MPVKKPTTITAYIKAAPKESRVYLREIRTILKSVAPKAKQTVKWGTPVFEEHRILFAFAAYKSHINFMPTPAVVKAFKKESANYKTGSGSIQIPYDKPLPKALIRKMAALRVKQLREDDAKWM